jgi:hypothetical protein
MSRQLRIWSRLVCSGIILTVGFSNCSKIQVSDIESTSGVLSAGEQVIPDLSGKQISTSTDLRFTGNQLDIALVIDDSGSMKDDGNQLAARLGEFVSTLEKSGIDWQMCWTDTDLGNDGRPKNWDFSNSATSPTDSTIVNHATNNFSRVFVDTVSAIEFGKGSGDERGVATLRRLTERFAEHRCLRPGAALTSIIISDEDERSAGGNPNLPQYKPIEDIDKPELMLYSLSTKAKVGRFVANSIVIRSTDLACLNKQASTDAANYGTFYERLSNLTAGGIGSICDSNYATHLNLFADKITSGLTNIPLICLPVDGSLKVTVDKPAGTYTYTLDKGALIFNLLHADSVYHVDLSYTCK